MTQIKDLIVATQGGTLLSGCGFGLRLCDVNSQCPLHEKYAPIRDAINTLVSTETDFLRRLIRGEDGRMLIEKHKQV
jgi:hypothetical protein